jgi:hypothetical protein
MQKLLQLKNYLLEASFLALLVYTLINGVEIGAALVLISLVSSMGYDKFLNKSKIDQNEALRKEIDEIKSKVNSLSIDKSLRRTTNEQENKPVTAARKLF